MKKSLNLRYRFHNIVDSKRISGRIWIELRNLNPTMIASFNDEILKHWSWNNKT
jgi:hypothetical protein